MRLSVAILALLSVAAASPTRADTIVLKNGERIAALNVTDRNGQVTYETPFGEMAIPKAIVARIERNDQGYSPVARTDSPVISAPDLRPPAGYDDIARLVVHDGAIDTAYIAALESAARTGASPAVDKAAAADFAAAQFLSTKGDADGAMAHLRQALVFAPDNMALLLSLSVLQLRNSQFTPALDTLDHARRIAPDNPSVAKLDGWAYYGANKLDHAIEEWQRSETLQPDREVEAALAKARRDAAEEQGYRNGETLHFSVKYYGDANPDLARDVLRALEADFNDLSSQLDYTPPEQIAVVLYTNQGFADITRAPDWVGALNDGRIRIPVQGLTGVTPDLARVLKHELTHSFIGQKTRSRAPVWLQEGVAQWMEGRRSGAEATTLLAAADQGKAPQLSALEGSWMGYSGDAAAQDYAWSLATVESIIANGGVSDISSLLEAIAAEPSTKDALRSALHCDYSDLQQQTIDYLRRESGQ